MLKVINYLEKVEDVIKEEKKYKKSNETERESIRKELKEKIQLLLTESEKMDKSTKYNKEYYKKILKEIFQDITKSK